MFKIETGEPADKCGAPDDYYAGLAAEVLLLRAKVACRAQEEGKVLDPNDPRYIFGAEVPVSPGDSFEP